MHALLRSALGFLLLFLSCSLAWAEASRTVDTDRLRLGDIALSVPEEWADVDLGQAPPPGSSRLVSRKEAERLLSAADVPLDRIQFADSMRIVAASRRFTRDELIEWLEPAIAERLEAGIQLASVEVRRGIVTSPSATIGRVVIPRLPKRAGSVRTSVVVELRRHGAVVERLSVPISLDVSREAAAPDVAQGQRVTLVIQMGQARVAAAAVALEAGDVGRVYAFRVSKTRKVLRARLLSRNEARVVSE